MTYNSQCRVPPSPPSPPHEKNNSTRHAPALPVHHAQELVSSQAHHTSARYAPPPSPQMVTRAAEDAAHQGQRSGATTSGSLLFRRFINGVLSLEPKEQRP